MPIFVGADWVTIFRLHPSTARMHCENSGQSRLSCLPAMSQNRKRRFANKQWPLSRPILGYAP